MSVSLPKTTDLAFQALLKALSGDLAHLKELYGESESISHLDVIISELTTRLKGARDMAIAVLPAQSVDAPVISFTLPDTTELPPRNGVAVATATPAVTASETPTRNAASELLSARERGFLIDEAILSFATTHQRLFSIDEVLDMLGRAGLETPRGSLVTKLSRMVDARILQRAFRGAYEVGPKAGSELDRVQRWRGTKL